LGPSLPGEAAAGGEPSPVRVVQDYAKDLPEVESNSLLVDVFLELITNAQKAMGGRPRRWLELRTRLEQDEAGSWVVAEVSDTGTGFTPEQMVHLWDMFQQSPDGLGFGLWWVRTFIEQQGGTIACESRTGAGATFTVRLPAVTNGEQEETG
jgi:signal transduction histidine kinase